MNSKKGGAIIGGAALALVLFLFFGKGKASASTATKAALKVQAPPIVSDHNKNLRLRLTQIGTLTPAMQMKMFHMMGAYESNQNWGVWNSAERSYGYIQSNLNSKESPQIELAKLYSSMGGTFSSALAKYKTTAQAKADFANYKRLMTQAASDPKMQEAQKIFAFQYFLTPAFRAVAAVSVLTLPITYYCLMDFLINFGRYDKNVQKFLSFFQGPNNKLDSSDFEWKHEQQNLIDFLAWRYDWMRKNTYKRASEQVRKYSIDYRIKYQLLLAQKNPRLEGPIKVHLRTIS